MHWADVAAKSLATRAGDGRELVLATGITPSGPIHIGNMREILTADMVRRALEDMGAGVRLLYISDTYDPLRKVYPFLDESYEKYIGWPLSDIPCPCGGHDSYADHFLEPFMEVLDRVGVRTTLLKTSDMYASGAYMEGSRKALQAAGEIRSILSGISGRELPGNWMPYNPRCESCGRMDRSTPEGFEDPYVNYSCSCGHSGRARIGKANGKLPWRVDWPARWWFLGIDFEPFGKDHSAAGGSYDTGSEIARKIYGIEPPEYLVYEWIQLKGRGAMSSSSGVTVSAEDMVAITPPQVLRFLIARSETRKHIDFDPGLPILDLTDDFDRYERVYHGLDTIGGKDLEDHRRIYEMACIPGASRSGDGGPVQVPLRHAATLVQIYPDDEVLMEKLLADKAGQADPGTIRYVRARIDCARAWIERFAPENARFALVTDPLEATRELDDVQRQRLAGLADALDGTDWEPEAIHNSIFEYAKSNDIRPGDIFRAGYRVFLNRDRGPKMGFFLSTLERDFVTGRLRGER